MDEETTKAAYSKTVYEVSYYCLSKGKDESGKVGNQRQFTAMAYVECTDTSKIESLLKKHYETPVNGVYFVPIIISIYARKGFVITEKDYFHCGIKQCGSRTE
jgi:hypothetical protein